MIPKAKKIIRNVVLVLGCIYSLVYFLACLTPFIHPKHLYIFTFLPLLFPYLLVGMLVWLSIVLLFYRKLALYFLFVFLMGYKNTTVVFSFHPKKEFLVKKDTNCIRVLSWNVQDFLDSQYHTDTLGNKRRDMMTFIKNVDADLVCIQDFTEQTSEAYRSSVQDVIDAGKYPYHFFSKDFVKQYHYALSQYGTCIFSRYPIVDSGRVIYPGKHYPESLAFADVQVQDKKIRVFNTHLQSMYIKFEVDTAATYDFITDDVDFLKNHTKAHERIRHFDVKHVQQAVIAKQQMNSSPYPFIFCADLNSVPSSYVYHTLASELTDAFTAKGSFMGHTYDGINPTLRIDVQLMSKQLKPVQYYSPRFHASDHFPIVTDIRFR
jgi:endonuclease/exonuclease/phosphatase family metal-dependent hydrolase